jgi:1-deoxy-D-xylulose-5-phosphate reductoisomerase
MTKKVAVLGSTGSIGRQALEVMAENPDFFDVTVLTANNNVDLLVNQAELFHPHLVIIGNRLLHQEVHERLKHLSVKVYAGEDHIAQVTDYVDIDIVLIAMVGFPGLRPTLRAIDAGKQIALANKETLVVAGELIMQRVAEKKVALLPVDSEHSAIFQCLTSEQNKTIEKIYLTASGGPFRGFTEIQLQHITPDQALKHPNWNMGAKITIDSATMMNKGLEVIEAKWLFDLDARQIEVIVHPQSVIHSLVQFRDGSMKAQMGLPDMRVPIQYALTFPERLPNSFKRFDFADYQNLTFEKPNSRLFRCLPLAFSALEAGGNMPCIMNAANEVAVEAFLNGLIGFMDIPELIEQTMAKVDFKKNVSFDDYFMTDARSRKIVLELIKNLKKK